MEKIKAMDDDVFKVVVMMGKIEAIDGLLTSMKKASEVMEAPKTVPPSLFLDVFASLQIKQIAALKAMLDGVDGNSLAEILKNKGLKCRTLN